MTSASLAQLDIPLHVKYIKSLGEVGVLYVLLSSS